MYVGMGMRKKVERGNRKGRTGNGNGSLPLTALISSVYIYIWEVLHIYRGSGPVSMHSQQTPRMDKYAQKRKISRLI
jgi:hypothetical protein